MPVRVVFIQQGNTRLLAPLEADVTLFGAADFSGGRAEGRFLKENLVAIGDVYFPVAAVEGFGPYQCRGLGGTPGKITRTRGNAANGNAISHGKRGDGVNSNVRAVRSIPNFNFLREAIVGHDIRVGLVNGGHEDVVSIRGGIEGFVIGGLTEGRDGEGAGIDESELREREVIEQILVVRIAEGVTSFVGTALALSPVGFLDTRTRKPI